MPRSLGVTSLLILRAVRDGVRYGLDIVSSTRLPSGTVYPTLGRLRKSGLLDARWEDQRKADREGRPRRKYYELTARGTRALEEGATQLYEVASALRTEATGETG